MKSLLKRILLVPRPVGPPQVTTEVIDDDDQHVVTAGAIVTVTVSLVRKTMESFMTGVSGADLGEADQDEANQEDREMDVIDTDEANEVKEEKNEYEEKEDQVCSLTQFYLCLLVSKKSHRFARRAYCFLLAFFNAFMVVGVVGHYRFVEF